MFHLTRRGQRSEQIGSWSWFSHLISVTKRYCLSCMSGTVDVRRLGRRWERCGNSSVFIRRHVAHAAASMPAGIQARLAYRLERWTRSPW